MTDKDKMLLELMAILDDQDTETLGDIWNWLIGEYASYKAEPHKLEHMLCSPTEH